MQTDRLWARTLWAKYGSLMRTHTTLIGTSQAQKRIITGFDTFMEAVRKGKDQSIPFVGEKLDINKIQKALKVHNQNEVEKGQRKIWKTKGSLHLNLCLWFMRHDRLQTTNLLFQRSLAPSPICSICGLAVETSIHAVRDCSQCSKVWKC